MWDLVGNAEDRFSHNEADNILEIYTLRTVDLDSWRNNKITSLCAFHKRII